jgi:large-conductance mechanosensitive channel
MSEIILNVSGKNYNYILIATLLFYILAMIICFVMVGNKKVIVEEVKKETKTKKTTKKRKTTK